MSVLRFSILFIFLFQAASYAGTPPTAGPDPQQNKCNNLLLHSPDSTQTRTGTMKTPLRGYGFLITIMAASAAVTTAVTMGVNPKAEFIPTFVSYIMAQVTFVTASLYSAQLEPLSNWLRKIAYKFDQKPQNLENLGDLEMLAQRVNALYTLRDQHATDRIMTFRLTLKQNLEAAARALETNDAEGINAQLVDILRIGYRLFREVDPSDPTIISAVRSSFLRKVAVPSSLYEPLLSSLKKEDPDFYAAAKNSQELSPQEYYLKALHAWLLDPTPNTVLPSTAVKD